MATQSGARLEFLGAPGSPYTRKMLALLRYRRIPHAIRWGGHQDPPAGYPTPKVKLLPTFFFPHADGGLDAVVDSTPIIRRLEGEHPGRAALPEDPVIRFLNALIEDYADEWLTKAMFHFRWAHAADAANAAPLLVFWSRPQMPESEARAWADAVGKRQIDRLYVVGSNATTAETIEASYARLVAILDQLIAAQGFVLGARPSSADFALYGQLTQLAIVEPTSAAITARIAPRVRAWTDRVEDLSGHEGGAWLARDEIGAVKPLLGEIGRVYAPFLIANAKAAAAGADVVETEIDARAWTQPTFAYQAKCLAWIREDFAALSAADQTAVRAALAGTGCDALLEAA
ncbi:MAG: glutathione S-transferase [Alphaproteobacteria bacterium]|nr:glutathione S-transferase [Alphaproteobacteria bacterium]